MPTIGNYATGTGGSYFSFSHTINGGSNRLLMFSVHAGGDSLGGSVCSGVTYNGIPMTLLPGSSVTHDYARAAMYYMLESQLPSAGTYTVGVSTTGDIWATLGGTNCFSNVSQTVPFGTVSSTKGYQYLSVSTSVGDTIFSYATNGGNSDFEIWPTPPNLELWRIDYGAYNWLVTGYIVATTSPEWIYYSGDYDLSVVGVAIKPPSGISLTKNGVSPSNALKYNGIEKNDIVKISGIE